MDPINRSKIKIVLFKDAKKKHWYHEGLSCFFLLLTSAGIWKVPQSMFSEPAALNSGDFQKYMPKRGCRSNMTIELRCFGVFYSLLKIAPQPWWEALIESPFFMEPYASSCFTLSFFFFLKKSQWIILPTGWISNLWCFLGKGSNSFFFCSQKVSTWIEKDSVQLSIGWGWKSAKIIDLSQTCLLLCHIHSSNQFLPTSSSWSDLKNSELRLWEESDASAGKSFISAALIPLKSDSRLDSNLFHLWVFSHDKDKLPPWSILFCTHDV